MADTAYRAGDYSTDPANNNSTAPNGAPEGMAPSGVNDAMRELAARLAFNHGDRDIYDATDTGSANTYVCQITGANVALNAGMTVKFKAANANSGASTLQVNSLTAKPLRKGGNAALVSGDIVANQIVVALYDVTLDVWTMLSPTAASVGSVLASLAGSLTATATELNALAGAGLSQAELQATDPSKKCTFYDDFLGDLIADEWTALAGTDPQCVAPAVNAGAVGGMCRMTTGDAGSDMATDGVSLVLGRNWQASKGGLVFEARVTFDAMTNLEFFIGLTDSIALEMPFTSNAAAVADDAVGFFFDTADDTTTDCVGVKATVVATAAQDVETPVGGTFAVYRIEVASNGNATFYVNGSQVGTVTNAVTAATLLTPCIAARSLTTASRIVDIDYVYVQQTR